VEESRAAGLPVLELPNERLAVEFARTTRTFEPLIAQAIGIRAGEALRWVQMESLSEDGLKQYFDRCPSMLDLATAMGVETRVAASQPSAGGAR